MTLTTMPVRQFKSGGRLADPRLRATRPLPLKVERLGQSEGHLGGGYELLSPSASAPAARRAGYAAQADQAVLLRSAVESTYTPRRMTAIGHKIADCAAKSADASANAASTTATVLAQGF